MSTSQCSDRNTRVNQYCMYLGIMRSFHTCACAGGKSSALVTVQQVLGMFTVTSVMWRVGLYKTNVNVLTVRKNVETDFRRMESYWRATTVCYAVGKILRYVCPLSVSLPVLQAFCFLHHLIPCLFKIYRTINVFVKFVIYVSI